MMKGVNLGNWLVLEKWMSPELFDGTSAEDEVHGRGNADAGRRRRRKLDRVRLCQAPCAGHHCYLMPTIGSIPV